MSLIGIIANPQSGKDIRSLVAEAAGIDNRQKVNIVRRVLLGIAAVGVDEVLLMPDSFSIGRRALEGIDLPFRTTHLNLPVEGTQTDSLEASRMLRVLGADCLVVLGGDGTHRVVAKECGDVPLVPISTGTNNVWPRLNEGTLAGLAAALVARGIVPPGEAIRTTPRLEIHRGESLVDIALVDVAVYDGHFTGTKALWEIDLIREIVLAVTEPGTLGLSSIGGGLPRPADAGVAGLYLRLGPGNETVLAPIGPGLVRRVSIQQRQWLLPGESVTVGCRPCLLALDGEREFNVSQSDSIQIRLSLHGPRMVDVPVALKRAAESGYFIAAGED